MSKIKVQTTIEGIHFWKDAPEKVKFLSYPHRHKFNISLEVIVHHDDRDIEFFILKNDLEKFIFEYYKLWHPDMKNLIMFGPSSCEMIAKVIGYEFIQKKYNIYSYKIEVREDEENSGIYEQ